jgi:HK97 family phage major capsid protein
MQSIQSLKAQVQDQHRAARNMLADKGSAVWNTNEQAKFDALIDSAEAAQAQIDAMTLPHHHSRRLAAEQRQGLDMWLRGRGGALKNAMSTTTPSQGGYTVAPVVAAEFVNMMKGYGWMRQVAASYTTTNGAPGSLTASDGTSEIGEQLGENGASTNLDPSFAQVDMTTYKFGSKVFTVPIELIQDAAIDMVAFIFLRARDRIGRLMNQRFTTGTGVSQPTGLVTASSVGRAGVTGQTTTIIYDDLAFLIDSVDEGQLGMPDSQTGMPSTQAGWMCSQAMRRVIRLVKDSNGRPVWLPSYGSHPAQLLDYPVYINNDMPVPAANAKSLAFGNLRSYTIRDALDVRLLRFDDSAFSTKGQVGFLAVARAGGNLADANAVKLYQHSAT